jgi:predicted transcriptional regulator
MPKLSLKNLLFEIPNRKHAKGERKMVSQRWPEDLTENLDEIAEAWGWNTTELVITALDQFVGWAKAQKREDPEGR